LPRFDKSKLWINSVKVTKGKRILLAPPSLDITFEVKNESGQEVRLDRISYTISLEVDGWTPTLGNGTYLENVSIPNGKTTPVTHEFVFDYEAAAQIDNRMKDFRHNISWKIQTKTFFFVEPVAEVIESAAVFEGNANTQQLPWTPFSIWKEWMDRWQKFARPKPYEYIEKLSELETRLRTMVENAKKGMVVSLSEKTEQLLTKVVEEIKTVGQKRFEYDFLTTEPRGTDNNPLNKRVEQMIMQSENSLEIMSPRIDRYYGEMGKASEKRVQLRIITQPISQAKGERKKFKKVAVKDLKKVAKVRETSIMHCRMIICDRKSVLLTTADITQDGLVDQFNYGIYSLDPRLVEDSIMYFEEVWRKSS